MATLKELQPLVAKNVDVLQRIEPLVDKHERVLYGNPEDRKDNGIVGAVNALEEMALSIKNWAKAIGLPVLIWAVLGVLQGAVDLYIKVQSLP